MTTQTLGGMHSLNVCKIIVLFAIGETDMNMTQFFCQAGAIVNHEIIIRGVFPKKDIINHWDHENGVAEYDGRNWSFKINQPVPQASNIEEPALSE